MAGLDSWATIGTAALGASIATVVWSIQSFFQRRWHRNDFVQSERAAREKEVRIRSDAKALEIVDILFGLEDLRNSGPMFRSSAFPGDRESGVALRRAIEKMRREALYLPNPVRQRVEVAYSILDDLEQLSRDFIRESSYGVSSRILTETREVLGQYLRGENIPKDLPPIFVKYKHALEGLEAWRESEMERQLEGGDSQE